MENKKNRFIALKLIKEAVPLIWEIGMLLFVVYSIFKTFTRGWHMAARVTGKVPGRIYEKPGFFHSTNTRYAAENCIMRDKEGPNI